MSCGNIPTSEDGFVVQKLDPSACPVSLLAAHGGLLQLGGSYTPLELLCVHCLVAPVSMQQGNQSPSVQLCDHAEHLCTHHESL